MPHIRTGARAAPAERRARLFTLEHSALAYRSDFALYAVAVIALTALLGALAPRERWITSAALTAAGLIGWSAVEYTMHRFVLHRVQPFRRWHEEHHQRPHALICTPTILSAGLIVVLVFLPALWLSDLWHACATTLGIVSGYLAYAITHHATHHWRAGGAWLRRRKHWHALHHHRNGEAQRCYGVTSAFWDHVCRSVPPRRRAELGADA